MILLKIIVIKCFVYKMFIYKNSHLSNFEQNIYDQKITRPVSGCGIQGRKLYPGWICNPEGRIWNPPLPDHDPSVGADSISALFRIRKPPPPFPCTQNPCLPSMNPFFPCLRMWHPGKKIVSGADMEQTRGTRNGCPYNSIASKLQENSFQKIRIANEVWFTRPGRGRSRPDAPWP